MGELFGECQVDLRDLIQGEIEKDNSTQIKLCQEGSYQYFCMKEIACGFCGNLLSWRGWSGSVITVVGEFVSSIV